MKRLLITAATLLIGIDVEAQDETKIKLSGYIETYYSYDFNKPADHNRPAFVYSHNRNEEVNVNLGYIKASYDTENIRANVALMAGTYANANLSAEPGVLKNVLEANVGLKLAKNANLWFDAGVFTSHIGFESAISKDCWVLTRNISSENTPYFESGAKVTYITEDGKFTAVGLYLNGWQRISRQDENNKPAGGVQLTWKPTEKLTLNYSNYLGTEGVDSARVNRFYNNFYGIYQVSNSFGVTVGLEYGLQQRSKGNADYAKVISPVVIARYTINPKWAVAGRFEYYQDKDGMFVVTNTPNGFKTTGYSMNVDYAPVKNAVVRLEGKFYDSKDKVFLRNNSAVNYNAAITASIAVSF